MIEKIVNWFLVKLYIMSSFLFLKREMKKSKTKRNTSYNLQIMKERSEVGTRFLAVGCVGMFDTCAHDYCYFKNGAILLLQDI